MDGGTITDAQNIADSLYDEAEFPAPAWSSGPGRDYGYGRRQDGTHKGKGWFGELPIPGGSRVATEYSMDIEMEGINGGKRFLFPMLVPGLTRAEIDSVLSEAGGSEEKASASAEKKAIDHAVSRIKQGRSPFADDDTMPLALPTE